MPRREFTLGLHPHLASLFVASVPCRVLVYSEPAALGFYSHCNTVTFSLDNRTDYPRPLFARSRFGQARISRLTILFVSNQDEEKIVNPQLCTPLQDGKKKNRLSPSKLDFSNVIETNKISWN